MRPHRAPMITMASARRARRYRCRSAASVLAADKVRLRRIAKRRDRQALAQRGDEASVSRGQNGRDVM